MVLDRVDQVHRNAARGDAVVELPEEGLRPPVGRERRRVDVEGAEPGHGGRRLAEQPAHAGHHDQLGPRGPQHPQQLGVVPMLDLVERRTELAREGPQAGGRAGAARRRSRFSLPAGPAVLTTAATPRARPSAARWAAE
jgi:hypothetical protein